MSNMIYTQYSPIKLAPPFTIDASYLQPFHAKMIINNIRTTPESIEVALTTGLFGNSASSIKYIENDTILEWNIFGSKEDVEAALANTTMIPNDNYHDFNIQVILYQFGDSNPINLGTYVMNGNKLYEEDNLEINILEKEISLYDLQEQPYTTENGWNVPIPIEVVNSDFHTLSFSMVPFIAGSSQLTEDIDTYIYFYKNQANKVITKGDPAANGPTNTQQTLSGYGLNQEINAILQSNIIVIEDQDSQGTPRTQPAVINIDVSNPVTQKSDYIKLKGELTFELPLINNGNVEYTWDLTSMINTANVNQNNILEWTGKAPFSIVLLANKLGVVKFKYNSIDHDDVFVYSNIQSTTELKNVYNNIQIQPLLGAFNNTFNISQSINDGVKNNISVNTFFDLNSNINHYINTTFSTDDLIFEVSGQDLNNYSLPELQSVETSFTGNGNYIIEFKIDSLNGEPYQVDFGTFDSHFTNTVEDGKDVYRAIISIDETLAKNLINSFNISMESIEEYYIECNIMVNNESLKSTKNYTLITSPLNISKGEKPSNEILGYNSNYFSTLSSIATGDYQMIIEFSDNIRDIEIVGNYNDEVFSLLGTNTWQSDFLPLSTLLNLHNNVQFKYKTVLDNGDPILPTNNSILNIKVLINDDAETMYEYNETRVFKTPYSFDSLIIESNANELFNLPTINVNSFAYSNITATLIFPNLSESDITYVTNYPQYFTTWNNTITIDAVTSGDFATVFNDLQISLDSDNSGDIHLEIFGIYGTDPFSNFETETVFEYFIPGKLGIGKSAMGYSTNTTQEFAFSRDRLISFDTKSLDWAFGGNLSSAATYYRTTSDGYMSSYQPTRFNKNAHDYSKILYSSSNFSLILEVLFPPWPDTWPSRPIGFKVLKFDNGILEYDNDYIPSNIDYSRLTCFHIVKKAQRLILFISDIDNIIDSNCESSEGRVEIYDTSTKPFTLLESIQLDPNGYIYMKPSLFYYHALPVYESNLNHVTFTGMKNLNNDEDFRTITIDLNNNSIIYDKHTLPFIQLRALPNGDIILSNDNSFSSAEVWSTNILRNNQIIQFNSNIPALHIYNKKYNILCNFRALTLVFWDFDNNYERIIVSPSFFYSLPRDEVTNDWYKQTSQPIINLVGTNYYYYGMPMFSPCNDYFICLRRFIIRDNGYPETKPIFSYNYEFIKLKITGKDVSQWEFIDKKHFITLRNTKDDPHSGFDFNFAEWITPWEEVLPLNYHIYGTIDPNVLSDGSFYLPGFLDMEWMDD